MSRHQGLIAPLLLILLGVTALLGYAAGWHGYADQRQTRDLALAKETLIARAAADLSRPGSLPCPDRITDSSGLGNYPGDGKADMLVRNECPSSIGWLPWITAFTSLTGSGRAVGW